MPVQISGEALAPLTIVARVGAQVANLTLQGLSTLTAPVLDVLDGFIRFNNIADPAAPADNSAVVYLRNSGGKDQLVVRFATGAVQQIAIEP